MEWNNCHYQFPSGQSTFLHQPLRPARPRYWYYDNEEEEDTHQVWQRDTSPQSDRYASDNGLASPPAIPSLKLEPSGTIGNGSTLWESFNSLGMPQLEESTEIQPFFVPQSAMFTDNQALATNLPPLPSPPTHLQHQQPEQKRAGQLPTQFSPQFPEFPTEPASYYPPPIPPPSPLLHPRPPVDYFQEAIPTLHSVHNSVPTLPSSIGSLEQHQPPPRVVLEDYDGDFDNSVAHDADPVIFNSPLPTTPTDSNASLRAPMTLPMGNFPARPSPSIRDNTSSDYSPVIAPLGRAKRGSGLSDPFTQMITTHEPKFSPDKRKLCCVEGCTSQARAFNRCKRHGGSKRCSTPGCTKSVQSRGLCIRHGGGSRCQEPGCIRASQSHGRCKMHGGGRPCIVAGCQKKAHLKRLCRKHGGGAKCCVVGCDKWAQRQRMCMTHSKVVATHPAASELIGHYERMSTPPPSVPDSTPLPTLEMLTHEV